jgi:hypothetical protein
VPAFQLAPSRAFFPATVDGCCGLPVVAALRAIPATTLQAASCRRRVDDFQPWSDYP